MMQVRRYTPEVVRFFRAMHHNARSDQFIFPDFLPGMVR